ncbi:hypothetical protein AWV79_18165 [Cupriavidus sp. UYMMa02A]|nr:hypothetical protein AWV79_18165 [Cupriavidus sp. UYMMa02A]
MQKRIIWLTAGAAQLCEVFNPVADMQGAVVSEAIKHWMLTTGIGQDHEAVLKFVVNDDEVGSPELPANILGDGPHQLGYCCRRRQVPALETENPTRNEPACFSGFPKGDKCISLG